MIATAMKYLGVHEGTPKFKEMIDHYNSLVAAPHGCYKMTYADPWCAAFVSLVAALSGEKNFPFSASCDDMLSKCGNCGYIITRKPSVGALVFFDWNGDGSLDHVGIVTECKGSEIVTIEGNTSDSCNYRTYSVNNKAIKCYASKIEGDNQTKEYPPKICYGSAGPWAAAAQALLIANGYDCGRCGIDGEIGNDSLNAIKSFCGSEIIGPNEWARLVGVENA